jgi:hypothetical protein
VVFGAEPGEHAPVDNSKITEEDEQFIWKYVVSATKAFKAADESPKKAVSAVAELILLIDTSVGRRFGTGQKLKRESTILLSVYAAMIRAAGNMNRCDVAKVYLDRFIRLAKKDYQIIEPFSSEIYDSSTEESFYKEMKEYDVSSEMNYFYMAFSNCFREEDYEKIKEEIRMSD